MPVPKAAPPSLNQRLADWQQKPEFAAVSARAAEHLEAAELEDMLALWDVLSGLSADTDMLVAAAVYLAPSLQTEHFTLRPEQLRLLEGLTASRKVWDIYRQHGRSGNAEGLRRLLLAIILDLRVLIVLLAWQLVQM
ncbi:MAG: hypothetical protein RLZZ537_1279, partial [Pseudomonadota bacterium]